MNNRSLLTALLLLSIISPAISRDDNSVDPGQQPQLVREIIEGEKSIEHTKGLLSVIQILDEMYGNTLERLRKGGKITIYIDPCHGQVNKKWSAHPTGRYSVTGITEELYSLMLIRKMYRHLAANPHIRIVTTDDYMAALKNEQDAYDSLSFRKTIKNAYDARAQMIISQHLNNVRYGVKATGTSNIPGIHIVHDSRGGRFLERITEVYKGFLTLYNRLDVSGFSRDYALGLKRELMAAGLQPNGWQRGAVADDRFIYFVDFPISLIYETGFISNPDDLEKITDPVMQDKIALAQYTSLLESIRNVFGVDISGREPLKVDTPASPFDLTLVKLSRMALYYMQAGKPGSAASIIDLMQGHYGSGRFRDLVAPYVSMKHTALRAESLYVKANSLLRKRTRSGKQRQRNVRAALNYLSTAKGMTRSKDFYDGIYQKYKAAYRDIVSPGWRNPGPSDNREINIAQNKKAEKTVTAPVPRKVPDNHYQVRTAEVTRPIIFVFEEHQTLKEAIETSMAPDESTLSRLHDSFTRANIDVKVKGRQWSRSRKRNVTVWRSVKRRVNFTPGMYVVKLDRDLRVKSAKRVSRVYLNPERYQNHLYLKNSHFAHAARNKSL